MTDLCHTLMITPYNWCAASRTNGPSMFEKCLLKFKPHTAASYFFFDFRSGQLSNGLVLVYVHPLGARGIGCLVKGGHKILDEYCQSIPRPQKPCHTSSLFNKATILPISLCLVKTLRMLNDHDDDLSLRISFAVCLTK
jgi:hypothetical protein